MKTGCMDGRSGRGSAGSGNLALNRLRTLGDRLVVDGFRAFSARPDRGLSLLIRQHENRKALRQHIVGA
jgi:hypothetical protein